MTRPIQPSDLSGLPNSHSLFQYLRDRETAHQNLMTAHAQLQSQFQASQQPANKINTTDLSNINTAMSVKGSHPLAIDGLSGLSGAPQYATFPIVKTLPNPVQTPYTTVVLTGTPNKLYQLNKDVSPPVWVQLL